MPGKKSPPSSTTKKDLVDMVYRTHGGLTRHEAGEVVNLILSNLKTSLMSGQSVKIHNFGVLEVVPRKGRMGVDPTTGDRIFIPPHQGLTFRPADRLKNELLDDD